MLQRTAPGNWFCVLQQPLHVLMCKAGLQVVVLFIAYGAADSGAMKSAFDLPAGCMMQIFVATGKIP